MANEAATMAARSAAIAAYLQRSTHDASGSSSARVELAIECVRDIATGRYRLPWKTVGALTAALAYFLSPLDASPDYIPLAGFIDDAAVLGLVFGAAEADLRRYCEWGGLDPDGYF